MRLETQRLLLRELRTSDLDAIHEYASDPIVVKYMTFGPITIQDSKNFIAKALSKQKAEPKTDFTLGITLKENDSIIGGCGLTIVSEIQANIGYILNKHFWGKGYATETAKALTEYGFRELGLHRVYATCDPDNDASIRVLEKVGMKLEGRLKENTKSHGEYRDSLILGILKREWANQTQLSTRAQYP